MKTHVGETGKGLGYLYGVLKDKHTVVSRVAFWKIPHDDDTVEDINLKIGRYVKKNRSAPGTEELPEVTNPKSVLTLDNEEFLSLIDFLQTNYEPFRKGIKQYIPLSEEFSQDNIQHLRALFANPEKEELIHFVVNNEIFPDDLIIGLQHVQKVRAVKEFEQMLAEDLVEHRWQEWLPIYQHTKKAGMSGGRSSVTRLKKLRFIRTNY